MKFYVQHLYNIKTLGFMRRTPGIECFNKKLLKPSPFYVLSRKEGEEPSCWVMSSC